MKNTFPVLSAEFTPRPAVEIIKKEKKNENENKSLSFLLSLIISLQYCMMFVCFDAIVKTAKFRFVKIKITKLSSAVSVSPTKNKLNKTHIMFL